MIPSYSGPTVFQIGPVAFPLFGFLVASGVFLGHAIALRLAAERRIPPDEIRAAAAWALGAGFLGAHVIDVLLYHPDKLRTDGILTLLKVWEGISSYGGFFGALVGVAIYFRRLAKPWWIHADILVQGLVFGWVFGRLGCTLTSDHLGRLSQFPLAFVYAGGARHNLGFYELLFTVAVLVPAILLLRRREASRGYAPGIYVAVIACLYAPVRFFLDFLRATDIAHPDPRWFGLTGAQYFSIALLLLALWKLRRIETPPGPATRSVR